LHGQGYHEHEVAYIIAQLLDAVAYLHRKRICHRDIKLDNIIVNEKDQTIKLIDFGHACRASGNMSKMVGTAMYMAPEVISQKGVYDEKVDLWSIGVVAYCMLANSFPFLNDDNIKSSIESGIYGKKEFLHRSRDARNFIANLLQVDPAKRFSAEEANNHPWIKENRRPPAKVAVQGRLDKLRNYRSDQVTHTVMTLIAHHSMADSNEQKSVFMELDSNHDGSISKTDLIEHGCSDYEAEKIISQANSSQTGKLSYTEWLVASSEKKELMSRDNLWNVFDFMDTK
jgi:calcium-dependent protein kinase